MRTVPAESFTATLAPPSVMGQFGEVANAVDVAIVGPNNGNAATMELGATGPPSNDAADTLITPGVTMPPPWSAPRLFE